MYTQFFGNYLLSQNIISAEYLVSALQKQSSTHLKLGTLAIHSGYLTAAEVDNIVIMQTHQDRKFGELAIENGYLTEEQVTYLLNSQRPDYLLLGQTLIEDGILSNNDFENLLLDYQAQNEIDDLDAAHEQQSMVNMLFHNFCHFDSNIDSDNAIKYLNLLFNNLIRFIGSDYSILDPIPCNEYATNYCVAQHISGKINIQTAIDMEIDAALPFASRYACDDFQDFGEFVQASIEDFLNLHNGLFNVNMSNEYSIELTLSPPEIHSGDVLSFRKQAYIFPIIYPFGIIRFIVEF